MTGTLDAVVGLGLGDFHLDVDLVVEPGEVVALLGPNGAGKTTLLRALAGLWRLERGHVRLGTEVWADTGRRLHVPPAERHVGVVFQDHLLFPHLTAVDNVAFGLRARGTGRAEATAQAHDWLGRVGLGDRADARPRQLSGGQAQRVALARTLATRPSLLALDEPLAALDIDARREVRRVLRTHLAGFDGPAVLVTHDPAEALALADRLMVIEAGRVTQTGTPAAVAAEPRSPWVAELVGLGLLPAEVHDGHLVLAGGNRTPVDHPDGPVEVIVSPDHVRLSRSDVAGHVRVPGVLVDAEVRGEVVDVRVEVPTPGGAPRRLSARLPAVDAAALDLAAGGDVLVIIDPSHLRLQAPAPT